MGEARAAVNRLRVLIVVLGSAGPCWAVGRGAPDTHEPVGDVEYHLGADLFAISSGATVLIAPGWRIGGAIGLGYSVAWVWTNIDGVVDNRLVDVVRLETLACRTLGPHSWLDMGVALGLSPLQGNGEYLEFGYSGLVFAEPSVGWDFLRFGTRFSGGYWISHDDREGEFGEHQGFAFSLKLVTAKVLW